MIRNPIKLRTQIFNLVVQLVLTGGLFWMVAANPPEDGSPIIETQSYVAQVSGACFVAVTGIIMSSTFRVVLSFPN